MKNATNKTKKSDAGLDAKPAQDLSKFTIFYLYKYRYIDNKIASICTFAGLDNMQMILNVFNEGKQDELLDNQYFTSVIISTLQKLCAEFSNPNSMDDHFLRFEERFKSYKIEFPSLGISSEVLAEWRIIMITAAKKWVCMDKSILENYDIQSFIKDYNLSEQAANVLCKSAGFTNVKRLVHMIFNKDTAFWHYEGCTFDTYKQIERACYLFITNVELKKKK